MAQFIPLGKLPSDLLAELLSKYALRDERLLVGPGIGCDAAVIDMGDRCLVAKSDPVTFATDDIGWYAVHVNANDIACCGAVPRWFLATLLLPESGTTAELAETIFRQISEACQQLKITLCGGHTEITHGLDRPIIAGHMLGEVSRDGIVSANGAQIGDHVILTKGIAIEGTALIAREKHTALGDVFSATELSRCAGFLRDPGISVVPEARIAVEVGGVHAMHDPTEGGLATGLWELASAANAGLLVDEASILVLPECARLCQHFGLDPLGLIGSGSLLIAAAPARSQAIIERLTQAGIAARRIAEVCPPESGCQLRSSDGRLRPLVKFARDEITKLFE